MKLPILIFALAASASAQTVTSDLQTAQTAIAAALTTIQNTPPPAPDPVAVALKLAGMYQPLANCITIPGCSITLVGWTCPAPSQWAPNTPYTAGAYILNPAGYLFQLTLAEGISGPTQPAWDVSAVGAVTSENSLSWVLMGLPGYVQTCVQGTTVPAATGPAKR